MQLYHINISTSGTWNSLVPNGVLQSAIAANKVFSLGGAGDFYCDSQHIILCTRERGAYIKMPMPARLKVLQ